MFERHIKFNTISQIKDFVTGVSAIEADFDIIHGKYIIDAKSIMGIFSLDLSNILNLRCHSDNKALEEKVDVILAQTGIFRP